MLHSLLSVLLLIFSFSPVATSFVHHSSPPRAFVLLSSESKTKATSQLLASMSTGTSTLPEIEVVSQPDTDFLEKKGVCESSETTIVSDIVASPLQSAACTLREKSHR
jgi:hypothetical protein